MTLEHLMKRYGVNGQKLFARSGFSSTGNIALYKPKPFTKQHSMLQRNIKKMAQQLVAIRAMDDYDFKFVETMSNNCLMVTSEKVYPRYCQKCKSQYYKRIQEDDDFCNMIATDIHTGILLFIGEYQEDAI